MYEVQANGEGAAEFYLSGGHGQATIRIDGMEGPLEFVNHKGDLAISVPSFDNGLACVITIRPDHRITVGVIR